MAVKINAIIDIIIFMCLVVERQRKSKLKHCLCTIPYES